MIYLKKLGPNKTEDLNLIVLQMIIGINESKTLTTLYHANVNVDLMEENVIQISGAIAINFDVIIKTTM